jgi:NAD(P)-dependent dehydrogenase (short-subunit alcohol dehydrogenase family)
MTADALRRPLSLFDVAGKVALITGASGAYGRTCAVALGALGAKLMLVSGDRAGLEACAVEARSAGAEADTLLRRPDSTADAEAIVQAAVQRFGRLDILVVASGVNKVALADAMPQEDWESVMDANVRGAWLMARAAGARFIQDGVRGKVLLLSSVRGRLGNAHGYSAYCTSKGATDALTRVLAAEWGRHGICVNAIAPTIFRSKLTAWIFGDDERARQTRERSLARTPLGRLGEPEDLVGITLYLVSRASDYCTGQVIYVDGGYTAA